MDYFFEILAFLIKVATIGISVFTYLALCIFLYLNYGLIPFVLCLLTGTIIFLIIEKKCVFVKNFFKEVGGQAEKTDGGNRWFSLFTILMAIISYKESESNDTSESDAYYVLVILSVSILILFTLYVFWN